MMCPDLPEHVGTPSSPLPAMPCSLHVSHRMDIYNSIYPHSASWPKVMLLSSSAVAACLAPAPSGTSHPLPYREAESPAPSQPHPRGRNLGLDPVLPTHRDRLLILNSASREQSRSSIHCLQRTPKAGREAQALPQHPRKGFFSQQSNCLMLQDALAACTN